jgi:hypothetical protein
VWPLCVDGLVCRRLKQLIKCKRGQAREGKGEGRECDRGACASPVFLRVSLMRSDPSSDLKFTLDTCMCREMWPLSSPYLLPVHQSSRQTTLLYACTPTTRCLCAGVFAFGQRINFAPHIAPCTSFQQIQLDHSRITIASNRFRPAPNT